MCGGDGGGSGGVSGLSCEAHVGENDGGAYSFERGDGWIDKLRRASLVGVLALVAKKKGTVFDCNQSLMEGDLWAPTVA